MLGSFEEKLEKTNGFETDFVKLLSYNLTPGYAATYRSQGHTRFCTILEGYKDLTVGSKSFRYNKNQSLLLPPHSEVFMSIQVPTKALVFEINDDLIRQVKDRVADNVPTEKVTSIKDLLLNNMDIYMGQSIQSLVQSAKDPQELDPFIIDLFTQHLVYDLLRNPRTGTQLNQQIKSPMEKVIQYMEQHLDKPFSSQTLADMMHMSPSNLSHSFKAHTGVSPIKYMHSLKMAHAKRLLLTMTVTETAYELAYETPSYFIRMFKNHYGCTPKKYQQQLDIKT